jgi:hypothetical protein
MLWQVRFAPNLETGRGWSMKGFGSFFRAPFSPGPQDREVVRDRQPEGKEKKPNLLIVLLRWRVSTASMLAGILI